MDKIYGELLISLVIILAEFLLIMLITETQEKTEGDNCCDHFVNALKNFFKFSDRQKFRLKALLIIFVGVCAGSAISYVATERHNIDTTFNDWILKGMMQMAYAFSAAVAAVYIRDGYALEEAKVTDERKQNNCDE